MDRLDIDQIGNEHKYQQDQGIEDKERKETAVGMKRNRTGERIRCLESDYDKCQMLKGK